MYKTRPLTIVLFILPALTIFLMYMLIPIPLSACILFPVSMGWHNGYGVYWPEKLAGIIK